MLRYKEIKAALLEMITSMQENEKIPSRLSLCKELDTTRVTLDKAIKELTDEGILTSEKGSGTYVAVRYPGIIQCQNSWGIIVPDIMEPIYAGIVRGIENVAQKNNINVTLCNSDSDSDKQEQYLLRLIQTGVSGMIIVPVISTNIKENCRLYDQLTKANIPFVFCNRMVEGVSAPIVTSNDYYGAYIGTKHLISMGYHKVAFISKFKYSTSTKRCYGYLTAIMESGLEINRQNIIMEEPDSGDLSGYSSMKMLLEQDPTIDAIFCFNDQLAQGVYKAIAEKGLKVSDDIGVIGYNNTLSLCERLTPELSSLSYHNTEIGKMAGDILLKLTNNKPLSGFDNYIMQPELVIRSSCLGPKKKEEC